MVLKNDCKKLAVAVIFTLSCNGLNNDAPQINATNYLTSKELEKVNKIIFEVQKVLDILDNFRETKALPYVKKLDVPGWQVHHKTEKILFVKAHKFIAEKIFELPNSCIKDIGGAKLNVCHIKLSQTLKKMGETYDCEVKTEELTSDKLKEKVKIICSY